MYDAANNGHLKVIELLLDRGASAVVKTDEGDTPLNILQEWQKNNPVYGDDLELYRSLVNRMNEAMEKAGQSSKLLVADRTSYNQSEVENVEKYTQRERESEENDVEESPECGEGKVKIKCICIVNH